MNIKKKSILYFVIILVLSLIVGGLFVYFNRIIQTDQQDFNEQQEQFLPSVDDENEPLLQENKINPSHLLQEVARTIPQHQPISFSGMSGVGQSFYRVIGEGISPDQIHTIRYGSPHDIGWGKLKESGDRSLEQLFPLEQYEYLGGFDRYVAYQSLNYKKAYYSEHMKMDDVRYYRILEASDEIHLSSQERENIGVWQEEPLHKVFHNRQMELTPETIALHARDILTSAIPNTAQGEEIPQRGVQVTFSFRVSSADY